MMMLTQEELDVLIAEAKTELESEKRKIIKDEIKQHLNRHENTKKDIISAGKRIEKEEADLLTHINKRLASSDFSRDY